MTMHESLIIKEVPGKGRGVIASNQIESGVCIESSPVIRLPSVQRELLDKTSVYDYYFAWGEDAVLALGYGSLYNHSFKPNAIYAKNYATGMIDFIALRKIEAGEEITVNYNGSPEDNKPIWFSPVSE